MIRQKKIALSPLIPTGSVEGSAGLRPAVSPPAFAYAAFASPRFLPLGPGGAAGATLSPRRHAPIFALKLPRGAEPPERPDGIRRRPTQLACRDQKFWLSWLKYASATGGPTKVAGRLRRCCACVP